MDPVDYLAGPRTRHDMPHRTDAALRDELGRLHNRCARAWGPPLDAGAALVEVTAGGRVAFVTGGGSAPMLEADLVDAVVHAARAGYRLCLSTAPDGGGTSAACWLPAEHRGDCEHRGWWRWRILYGYHGPITQVCPACTPHCRTPVPDTCPH